MKTCFRIWLAPLLFGLALQAWGQTPHQVVDIPTRAGVTQRLLVLTPPQPKAALLMVAGGHGGLQITPQGGFGWGEGNFVVRTRQMFADQGVMVAVLDAPSDRQRAPFLAGFRQTPDHAEDIRAAIAWLRTQAKVPVWLVGTSRGTQSAAYVALQLPDGDGPDGLVLSSTILTDNQGRAVPAMPLGKLHLPVLVVHHAQDGCSLCRFSDVPLLMDKLANVPRKQLLTIQGGLSRGDPCEAMAYHGFNGVEREVVEQTVAWILAQ